MSVSTSDHDDKKSDSSEDEVDTGLRFRKLNADELKKITVKILMKGQKSQKVVPIDFSNITPVRRNDEGTRPIFDRPEIKEFYLRKQQASKIKHGDSKDSAIRNLDSCCKKCAEENLKTKRRRSFTPSPERRKHNKSKKNDDSKTSPNSDQASSSRSKERRQEKDQSSYIEDSLKKRIDEKDFNSCSSRTSHSISKPGCSGSHEKRSFESEEDKKKSLSHTVKEYCHNCDSNSPHAVVPPSGPSVWRHPNSWGRPRPYPRMPIRPPRYIVPPARQFMYDPRPFYPPPGPFRGFRPI